MKREKIGVRRCTSSVSLVVIRNSPAGATACPSSLRVKVSTFSSIVSARADISSPAGRQHIACPVTLEELDAEPFLQLSKPPENRGVVDAEPVGGGGEPVGFGDDL